MAGGTGIPKIVPQTLDKDFFVCLSAVGKIPAALAKANSNTITTFPRFQQAVEDYHLVHTVEGVYCTFPFLNMQDLLQGGGQDGHHAGNGDK